jgi:RHS repeat-associated protein
MPWDAYAYVLARQVDEDSDGDYEECLMARIFDPFTGRNVTVFDDLKGADHDGEMTDVLKWYKSADLDASTLAGSSTLTVVTYDGYEMVFNLVDLGESDDPGDDLDMHGILASFKAPNGLGWTISTSIDSDGKVTSRTVTSAQGDVLVATYGALVAGKEAISSLTCAGATSTFEYDTTYDVLKKIIYDTGEEVVITTTINSGSQCVEFAVNNPCGVNRTIGCSLDFFELPGGIIGQPQAICKFKADTCGNNLLTLVQNPSNPDNYIGWQGTNQYLIWNLGESIEYCSSVSISNPTNWFDPANTFLGETYHEENIYGLTQPGGPDLATRMAHNAPEEIKTLYGETVELTYDTDFFWETMTYEDNTFVERVLDSNKNVTQYRDRNANVTQYVYSGGNLTEVRFGLFDNGTSIVQTADYAIKKYAYDGNGRLQTAFNELWTNETDLYRTDYAFTSGRLTSVTESADVASGSRALTQNTYTAGGFLWKVTDPLSRVTEFVRDDVGRVIKTIYHDSSFTESIYTGGKLVKTISREGIETTYAYDSCGRMHQVVQGSNGGVLEKVTTTYAFIGGTNHVDYQVVNGKKTDYSYDYRYRVIGTDAYAYHDGTSDVMLSSSSEYTTNHRLFCETDHNGNKTFLGYDPQGYVKRAIQVLNGTTTYASVTAVMNATRILTANPSIIITDAIHDPSDSFVVKLIDGMGNETVFAHDYRGRKTNEIRAYGETIAAQTKWFYDLASNVTQIQYPRYHDSGDTYGYNAAKTTMTYNGRGLLKTETNGVSATTEFTYLLDGNTYQTEDPLNNVTTNYYQSCCGRFLGVKNALDNGSISNTDHDGRVSHSVIVEDFDSHTSNTNNPVDGKTHREVTTKYDALGRPIAKTVWLTAQGLIDPTLPPIAGLDSVSAAAGLTSQTIYDDNLSDNVGLDNSTGVTMVELGSSSTYLVSLADALAKLADTVANGGAEIEFSSNAAGSAVVTIDPSEKVIQFSISDAIGRTVMSGQIESRFSGNPNDLLSWTCMKYDESATISGFGPVVEHWTIDPDGEVVKVRVDGGRRALEIEDQDSNISTAKYDANGNQLEVRDANGIGYAMVYDELNRITSKTDTYGDTISNAYDKAGNLVSQTDAKSKATTIVHDAIDRRKQVVDRISGVTQFTYDLNNKLTSVTDAESKVTAYEYDDIGQKIKETYDDHTGGSSGDSSYGIREFTYDPAGQLKMSTDQKGDTISFNRNIAGLLTSRETRTKANSPSGTTSSVASFTYTSGRMATASMSGPYTNSVTNSYDDNGFLESQTSNVASVNYTVGMDYDFEFGRINELILPDTSTVEYTYNDRGLRYETKYNSTTIDARAYDAGGRLTTSAFNNGVTTTFSYRVSGSDKDNMIAEIDVDKSSTTLDHFAYTYDENKNKTTETRTGTMSAYSWTTNNGGSGGYDDEDRLNYWKRADNSLIESISLSAVGNRNSVTINSTTETNTFSDAHELAGVSGGSSSGSLIYDSNGNLVTDNTKGHTYQWNIEGQLISADTDADTHADVTFEYDALGRPVKKGNTVYVYYGDQVVAEYPSGSAASLPSEKFVYGEFVDEPIIKIGTGGVVYYHSNAQNSITMLTDSVGAPIERYSYSVEGYPAILEGNGTAPRALTAYENEYLFTSRRFDPETKLNYHRNRYYSPSRGMFMSRDPLGHVDGASLYQGYFYANGIDPYGLLEASVHLRLVRMGYPTQWRKGEDGNWNIPHDDYTASILSSTSGVELGLSFDAGNPYKTSEGILAFQSDHTIDASVDGFRLYSETDQEDRLEDLSPNTLYKQASMSAGYSLLGGLTHDDIPDGFCVQCRIVKAHISWDDLHYGIDHKTAMALLDFVPTGTILAKLWKEYKTLKGWKKEMTAAAKKDFEDFVKNKLSDWYGLSRQTDSTSGRLHIILIVCGDRKRYVGVFGLPKTNRIQKFTRGSGSSKIDYAMLYYEGWGGSTSHHYPVLKSTPGGGPVVVNHGSYEVDQ